MIDHSIGIPRAQTNHLHSGRLPLEQVFNSTLRNATLTLAQESHGGVQEPKLIIIIGKLFRSDTFTPDAFTNLLEKSAPKKDGPRHFRRGRVHLERPNLTGAIFAVFFRNELIFGMNTHLSSQSSLHYLSGRAEKETIKNRPFFTFSGHFSGSPSLILTHPTSKRSYIMFLGSQHSLEQILNSAPSGREPQKSPLTAFPKKNSKSRAY